MYYSNGVDFCVCFFYVGFWDVILCTPHYLLEWRKMEESVRSQ